jgi:hypothetical protein
VKERPDQYTEFMKVAETPQFNGRVKKLPPERLRSSGFSGPTLTR